MPATCLENGQKVKKCSRCEFVSEEDIIPKTDHKLKDGKCEYCGISLYGISVKYTYSNGTSLGIDAEIKVWEGESYNIISPEIDGFVADIPLVKGVASENKEIVVTYSPIAVQKIVNIKVVDLGIVKYNTQFSDLLLPNTVVGVTEDDREITLDVYWSSSSYSATTYGNQQITGTVCSKYGYEITDTALAIAKLSISNIVIAEIPAMDLGKLPLNTSYEGLGLPTTAGVKTLEGEIYYLPVTWNTYDYNPAVEGAHSIKGTITLVEGYSLAVGVENEVVINFELSAKMYGTADIVFIVDTTGSMGDEIRNVKNNIVRFAEKLESEGVSVRWALLEYRDITCDGVHSTKIIYCGSSEWFIDVASYQKAIGNLSIGGGGDREETVIDALKAATLLETRINAKTFYMVVTDADYKVNNSYGVSNMEEMIEELVYANTVTSVVTKTQFYVDYKPLTDATGGILANIDGDFASELWKLLDLIVDVVVYGDLESIEIVKAPNKTEYVSGDSFNGEGMIVRACYKNGLFKDITAYSVYPNRALKTTDTQIEITFRGKMATIDITVVSADVPVTGISVSKGEVSLTEGEFENVTAIVFPNNATNKGVIWVTDNSNIAVVENGRITAVGVGVTTIRAISVDGGFEAQITVTVCAKEVAVSGLYVDKGAVEISVGEQATVTATILPTNATNKAVEWISSNDAVATVENGVIRGISNGTATITVTTVDGNYQAKIFVVVNPLTHYTVEYYFENINDDEYSIDNSMTTSIDAKIGLSVSINPNAISHYKINDELSILSAIVVEDGLTVLKVFYERERYMVTFNGNGGTFVSGETTQSIKYQGSAIAPIFTREDSVSYTWDKSFENVTEDISVNAVWEINWLTIYTVEGNIITGLTSYGKTLTTLTIPEQINSVDITAIADFAFDYDSAVEIINISANIETVGYYSLMVNNLKQINVDANNAYYSSIDGNLYNKDATILVRYAIAKEATSFSIPSSVVTIGMEAVSMAVNLENIIFATNGDLTTIDSYAFADCIKLTSIKIPQSVTCIGTSILYNCSSLEEVFVSGALTSYGGLGIEESNQDCRIYFGASPDELIAQGCDFGNIYITIYTYFYMEEFLNIFNETYFYIANFWHYNDGEVEIWETNGLTYALASDYCSYMVTGVAYPIEDVVIPASIGDVPVTEIGEGAFYYYSGEYGIVTVTIPNSIEIIGSAAFAYCSTLERVYISEDSRLETIGYLAFGHSGLTEFYIPASVNCIGDSENNYYRSIFGGCSNLTNITVANDNAYYKSIDGNLYTRDGTIMINYAMGKTNDTFIVPESVTELSEYAFEGSNYLTNVYFTENSKIELLESSSFYDVSSIETFVLPEGLKCVYDYSVNGFSSVQKVFYLGSAIDWMAMFEGIDYDGTFANATIYYYIESEECVPNEGNYWHYVDGVPTIWEIEFEGINWLSIYTVNGNTITGLTEYGQTLAELTIPEQINGVTITTLDFDDNYERYAGIESFAFGGNITTIGENVFASFESINNIYYTGTIDQWAQINYEASWAHPSLMAKEIYIGGVQQADIVINASSINTYAFYYFSWLKTIVIGNGVTSIGADAFFGCDNLESIYYYGTEEEYYELVNNSPYIDFRGASVYYYAESKVGLPIDSKCYWHYVDGVPTIWDTSLNWLDVYTVNETGDTITGLTEYGQTLTELTIPEQINGNTIISIGDSAFRGHSSLTSVTIPNTITSIGELVFAGCHNLSTVKIPNGVTTIRPGLFEGCNNLTSVTIGSGVTSIGDYAFFGCNSLISIEIPNKVTSIGEGAFWDCDSLTSVVIPNSVTSIGLNAFTDCDSLTSITVDENNINYKDIDGNLYSKDVTVLIQYAIGKTATNFEIPNSVTSIGDSAFNGCSSLISVVIPNKVTIICGGAFWNCDSLTSVVIGSSVTTIGYNVFDGCVSLTRVYYMGLAEDWNKISIGAYNDALISSTVYYYIENEVNVPNEGNYWHYVDGVPTVWDTSLNWLDVYTVNETGDTITGLTEYGQTLTELTIPEQINGVDVTAIATNAISFSVAEVVNISANINRIEDAAFIFAQIKQFNVDAGNLYFSSIDGNLYNRNATILIAYAVGKDATSFAIPNSVETIHGGAFYGISGEVKLETITFGTTGKLTTIGEWAFVGCNNLVSLHLPQGVTTIGEMAFCNCASLIELVIPNTVSSITGMIVDPTCKVYYGGSIDEWIEKNFSGVLPEGGSCCFYAENFLDIFNSEYLYYEIDYWHYKDGEIKKWETNGLIYGDDNGSYKVIGIIDASLENVVVPESIEGVAVTSIAENAFSDMGSGANIKTITIPNSIKSIGVAAFAYCSNLERVYIGENSQLQTIGYHAFGWTGLTEFYIPASVNKIGDGRYGGYNNSIFSGCSSLTNITVANNNSYYKSVDGNLYTKDGTILINYAMGKTADTFIVPESVIELAESSFEGANNLKNIYFAENSQVDALKEESFFGMTSIENIVLPSGLTTINEMTGEYFDKIKKVYCFGNANAGVASAFSNATIYYYVENESDLPTDDGNYWHYVDGVPTIWA